jgi:hypothetical protein
MIALTPIKMVHILWTLIKSHTTFIIITQDTAANNKDLITMNILKTTFGISSGGRPASSRPTNPCFCERFAERVHQTDNSSKRPLFE